MINEKEKLSEQKISEQRKRAQKQGVARHMDIDVNACTQEHRLSFNCIAENPSDKDQCQNHFDNYKNCRSFWNSVKIDRRNKGIYPDIPTAEERETIKAEYISKNKRQPY